MKKAIAILFILLLCSSGAAVGATQSEECSHVTEAMNKAGEKVAQAGVEIYDEMVKQPEDAESFMDRCLGGIMSGTGITLGIPDFDIDQLCRIARSKISDQLKTASQNVSVSVLDGLLSGGVSTGTSSTSSGGVQTSKDVRVKDTSGAVRDSIWDAIGK